MHFDASGPVQTVDFDYDAVDGVSKSETVSDSRDNSRSDESLLRLTLTAAFSSQIRPDAMAARVGAVCWLIKGIPGYGSLAEAARTVHVSERTLKRAVARLRAELRAQKVSPKNVENN